METAIYRGKWHAVWYEGGKTKRASLRTTDRDEARRRLIDFERKAAKPPTTVGEIAAAYMADKADGPSAATNKFAWQALEATFGHLRPDQVTRDLSRAYADMRRKAERSDNTIHRELGVLNAALRWHDRRTPAIVELPPKPPPKTTYVLKADIPRLLRGAASPHIRLFMAIAYRTAARTEAILDLTWDRVNLKRRQIDFSTGRHSYKGRAVVPIGDTLLGELEEAKRGARTDFVIEYGEQRVKSIKKGFARAAVRAGMPEVTPHVLRHTAAVHMAEAGRRMEEIAQVLGHSSTKVTERVYARFSPDYLRGAVSALD
jgi:integrase